MTGYRTIVADPPWDTKRGRYGGDPGLGFLSANQDSRPLAYETLTPEAIAALPVLEHVAAAAHLYLWTTNGYLRAAFDIAVAWGFTYSTTLVWAKKPMGGGLGGTYGISTEFCLFCRRGSLAAKQRVTGTWFPWKRPYDERGKPRHSAKPPAFMEMVEQTSPGPYLELFAREARLGWDRWGDEVDSTVELAA